VSARPDGFAVLGNVTVTLASFVIDRDAENERTAVAGARFL
jgi:hypothetical protein